MKTILTSPRNRSAGYALLMVMTIIAVSLIVLAATMQRTSTVATLNNRSNTRMLNINAAEAAVEKVYARMAYDFGSSGSGLGAVTKNLSLYRTNVPTAAECSNSFWGNFEFSNGQGVAGQTYVALLTNYTGPLPSQYPSKNAVNAPVYRIVSNARNLNGAVSMTNAVQVDVLLALVPLCTYAIFYNGLLEFSTAATMTVNGRVHANANIYVGSSAKLTFNDTVTTTGTISAPQNNGGGPGWTYLPTYNGNPTYKTNVPTLTLSMNMTNTHALIDLPPTGELPTSVDGEQRLYNQAHVVLLVSNSTVTALIQTSVSGQVPGADTGKLTLTSPTNVAALATNFPFLTITNKFVDQREDKTNLVAEIDVKKYGKWITTNSSVISKFPTGSGTYPTILYVANNRSSTSTQLPVVRLVNGADLPKNGGLGYSVATPNPLYVKGDYNVTNSAVSHPDRRASTNTTATVPAAVMSDALTILSTSWSDSSSFSSSSTGPNATTATTVNAAILTGIVASTGNTSTTFSGGVHNLPRLLENWGSSTLWLNTSIINLFNSTKATGKFVTPGSSSYYVAPTRQFSFDQNFLDPAKQPPGMPCALVPIRFNWAVPPANTVTYNVVP